MYTATFKIYGRDGHRQRESFHKSARYDWTDGENVRIVEIQNADKTGTHDYSLVTITRNTEKECLAELDGQLSDGIFENSRIGKVERI